LGLDVVFFRCAERAVPEQIFSAEDIFRIMNRPEGQSGMPESMQIHAKSERCASAPSDTRRDSNPWSLPSEGNPAKPWLEFS